MGFGVWGLGSGVEGLRLGTPGPVASRRVQPPLSEPSTLMSRVWDPKPSYVFRTPNPSMYHMMIQYALEFRVSLRRLQGTCCPDIQANDVTISEQIEGKDPLALPRCCIHSPKGWAAFRLKSFPHGDFMASRNQNPQPLNPSFVFTLVTGPRRSLSLKLSDTRVYEPQMRANRTWPLRPSGARCNLRSGKFPSGSV